MLRHKNIDRICCIVLAATLLLTCCYMGAAASGMVNGGGSIGYENRLFDQSRVHTIDIVMDDWDAFLATCTREEYAACTVIIDGESYGDAAIRGKGNTSLSSVSQYGNDRYSFKIEFDQYQPGRTYHGLDKLSLNNIIQDKTYLKDYLAYTLMNKMGVAAPLCSFAQIRVNGEDWGFYLAVEGVEDSFLRRNYGTDAGELYKPDSMSFGGGRGNGMDFDMEAFVAQFEGDEEADGAELPAEKAAMPFDRGGFDPAQVESFNPAQMERFAPAQMGSMQPPEDFGSFEGGRGMGGRGSSDVKLQYIDDDPASYSNIFDNAKTDVSDEDKARLIASLKTLSEGDDIASVVDTEAVIRYFVVHNFLCNDDSYTGQMIHNYYLYEEGGVLSMIPWDYNLAFGGFSMGGMNGTGATSAVNTPIDTLVSSGDVGDRPMAAWIFANETYAERYHEVYGEFIAEVFESGWFEKEITRVTAMIEPFVEADEKGFFSYDEFCTGAESLKEFCLLRAESVSGQLEGTIPSTSEAQRANSTGLIAASHIDLSDMGEFGMGHGDRGGEKFGRSGSNAMQVPEAPAIPENTDAETDMTETPADMQMQSEPPAGFDPGMMQGQPPAGFDPGMMQGQPPTGFDPGMMQGQPPAGFDPGMMQNISAVQPMGSEAPEAGAGIPEIPVDKEVPPVSEVTGQAADITSAEKTGNRSGNRTMGERRMAEFPEEAADIFVGEAASSEEPWLLLAGSIALLAAAILFAKLFKGRF